MAGVLRLPAPVIMLLLFGACTSGEKPVNRRGSDTAKVDCTLKPDQKACQPQSDVATLSISGPQSAESGKEILITWDVVDSAATYNVIISLSDTCLKPEFEIKNITSLSQAITLSKSGEYYLCVDPYNEQGEKILAYASPYRLSISQGETSLLKATDLRGLASTSGPNVIDFIWAAASDPVHSIRDYTLHYYDQAGCAGGTYTVTKLTGTSYQLTKPVAETTYSFTVEAFNTAGESVVSECSQPILASWNSSVDTIKPSPGSEGVASVASPSATGFNLTWLAATDDLNLQAGLEYFVCSGPSLAAIDTVAECLASTEEMAWTPNTTNHVISGKSPSTTYYYNIVVKDSAGNSAAYSPVSHTTLPDLTPPTGGSFAASTGVTQSSFTLNWQAASDLVTNAASLQYFVCSGPNSLALDSVSKCLAATQEMPWTANTTSLALSGKSPATTYFYNVVVKDTVGNQSLYDGLAQATLADLTPPAPGGFSASTGLSDVAFTLNWQAASDLITLAAGLEYFVCSGANAAAIDTYAECSAATQEMNWSPNTTSLAIIGKAPATAYYYNVAVRDAAGNTALYDGKSQTTLADTTNPTAGSFAASSGVSDTAFTLNWSATSDNVTPAAGLEYFVCSGASAAAIDTIAECTAATQAMNWTANTTTLARTSMVPATTYHYNIVVRDAAGNRALYDGISQATLADTTNPTPGSFIASTGVSGTGFTLNWQAGSDNATAAASLEYFVCSGANAAALDTAAKCAAAVQELNWTANTTSLALSGKAPATTYYYNVLVRDSAGNTALYNGHSQATPSDATSPTAGTFGASTSVTDVAFTLNWSAASDNITAAAGLEYFVCSGANAAALDTVVKCTGATQAMNWTANTTSLAISGKAPATTYYYNVVVRDAAGNTSLYDGISQATLADTTNPTAGAFAASTSVTDVAFTLNWSAGSDLVTTAASLEYFVCSGANAAALDTAVKCTGATQAMNWTANTTSLAISGKAPATTYYYNVVVRDAAGNTSLYDGISQATLADTTNPTAGTFAASTSVTDVAFTLNWSAGSDLVTAAAGLEYFVCSGANAAALDTVVKCTGATQAMNWTANTTSLAISGKTPATTYYYNVVVRDAAGNTSLYDGISQATLADTTNPTAGTFAASTGVTDVAFTLNWSAGSDLITAAAGLEYFVCSGANAAALDTVVKCTGATQAMNWTANTTSLAITGKTPATTYYYNVVVRDAAGNTSLYDGISQATLADTTNPTAGTFAASTGVTDVAFTLNWSAGSDLITAAAGLEYFVCSGANAAALDTVVKCTGATQAMNWTANTTSLAVTGKTPATTYYYNVVVRDAAGNTSLYDGISQATLADTTNPTAGTFAASTSVTDVAFTLNWSAGSDLVTAAASLEYFVCSGANAAALDTVVKCTGATQEMNWTANTTSLAITGKAPVTTYYYNVVVRDAAGNTALYNGLSQATAADTTIPVAGSVSSSTIVTDRSFVLRWAAASDLITAASNLEYFVCSGANAAALDTAVKCTGATQVMNWTANTTSLAVTGRSASTTYYYNIVARDAAGNMAIYGGITQATHAAALAINSGDAYTNNDSVSLAVTATNASDMLVTNTAACASGSWEAYNSSKSTTLGQTNASATVYIMFKDSSGVQSPCISDTIIHDNVTPTGESVTISSNDTYTTSSSVTLGLAATGASEMYITNTAGCGSGGTWEAYATAKASWPLNPLNSSTNVYAKFRDEATNTTACTSDDITHDGVNPTTPSSFSDGSTVSSSRSSPAFTWGASTDGGSGLANYQVALGTTSGGTEVQGWTNVGVVTTTTLTGLSLQPAVTYYGSIRAVDNAGRISSVANGDGFVHSAVWTPQAYLKAANADADDYYGGVLSLWEDTLAVGLNYENSNQTTIINGTGTNTDDSKSYSGAVYIYKRTGTNWAQEAFLKPYNNRENNYFGDSVALRGDLLLVGAPDEPSSNTTITYGATTPTGGTNWNSGAVYVYARSGTTWAPEAHIKPPVTGSQDFGDALAFDGSTLLVGAKGDGSSDVTITNGTTGGSDTLNSMSGAVYVLARSGTVWTRQAHLKAPNAAGGDRFGMTIAISGAIAAVGTDIEKSNQTTITNGTTASSNRSLTDAGAVYVYRRTGTTWENEAYIKPPNTANYQLFGHKVRLEGTLLAVSAKNEHSAQTTILHGTGSPTGSSTNTGAVFIYKRTGTTWAQEAIIKAPNALYYADFGSDIDFKGDTLVVGSMGEDSNQTSITNGTTASTDESSVSSGAAYVFRRLSNGTWVAESYIKAANNNADDRFGAGVSFYNDTIAVGASHEDSEDVTITNGTTASTLNNSTQSGAVYIYTR